MHSPNGTICRIKRLQGGVKVDHFPISRWEQRIYSRLLFRAPVGEPAPVSTLRQRMASWSPWRALAVHYLWEDLFWRHKTEGVDWLGPLIRL